MRVLMFLFYGGRDEYRLELMLSLLSAHRQMRAAPGRLRAPRDALKICVVTDQRDLDPALPIDVITVDHSTIERWATTAEGHRYNHRAKIGSMLEVMTRHPGADVTFVDSDTIFTQDPALLFERIDGRRTVLHKLECPAIEHEPIWTSIIGQIGAGIEVAGVPVRPSDTMFNSGVIGVSANHRQLVERCLPLTDRLVSIDASIMNLEQFAFSRVLDEYTTVESSDDIVRHYCDHSRRFIHLQADRLFGGDFSAANFEALLADRVDLDALGYPPIPAKNKAAARAASTLLQWDDMYRFAYLCTRNAASAASVDDGYANLWAATALEQLRMVERHRGGRLDRRTLARDMGAFRPSQIDHQPWLSASARSAWHEFWATS